MNDRTHLRAGPFILAVAVAVAVVLSAPVVGQIRGWIRSAFPGRFVLIVGAIGAVLLAAALVAAAFRIRERRALRYGAIAAAIAIAVIYSALNPSDTPESIAVERFHFLEYGLITFLFYRAWRPLGDLSIVLLPILAGLIAGTAEEWLQWFIPNRVGELRDIFLNLAAIVSGLLFSVAVDPPARFAATLSRASAARVLRLAAATIIVLAAFLHVVHLGYEIVDPDVGSFMSRYAPGRLPALQGREGTRVEHPAAAAGAPAHLSRGPVPQRRAGARPVAQQAMGRRGCGCGVEREPDPGRSTSCRFSTHPRTRGNRGIDGRRNSAPMRKHARRPRRWQLHTAARRTRTGSTRGARACSGPPSSRWQRSSQRSASVDRVVHPKCCATPRSQAAAVRESGT